MLRPSKKLVLALTAVTDIAYHGGAEPVQSQDIARRLSLPRRYLEQVMQQLVRAGILRGVRGPRGGYRLARERRRVSVGDVVRVVRGIEDTPVQEELAASSELGRQGDRSVLGRHRAGADGAPRSGHDRGSVPSRRGQGRGQRGAARGRFRHLSQQNAIYCGARKLSATPPRSPVSPPALPCQVTSRPSISTR